MNARITKSYVVENIVNPVITFEVEITYTKSKILPLGVNGRLKTREDIILAPLMEILIKKDGNDDAGQLAGFDSSSDLNLFVESKYIAELSVVIDEKIINYIEDTRKREPTHSVEFQLELYIKYLESNFRVAHLVYAPVPPDFLTQVRTLPTSPLYQDDTDISIMMSARRERFNASRSDGWILSGDGNPIFLKMKIEKIESLHKIDVGHWIEYFLPKLGLGKRLLVEIPADGKLFDDLDLYLSNAETGFRRWDSKSVFANCREIGTYLNNKMSEIYGSASFIRKERWGRAYANFSKFASLDLHLEDISRGNSKYSKDEITVNKSDTEYLLTQTKLLINYAQELIGKHR